MKIRLNRLAKAGVFSYNVVNDINFDMTYLCEMIAFMFSKYMQGKIENVVK